MPERFTLTGEDEFDFVVVIAAPMPDILRQTEGYRLAAALALTRFTALDYSS